MIPCTSQPRLGNDVTTGAFAISVIIPAHNEEAVIDRCLCSVEQAIGDVPTEVIVVVNGSSDRTAEIARQHRVRVLELEAGSKTAALNAGDAAASAGTRIYLDADVAISRGLIASVSRNVGGSSSRSAYMKFRLKPMLSRSSMLVRAYYRVWQETPYCRDGVLGSGLYCLSQVGRSTFDRFPDLISDDGFVAMNLRSSAGVVDREQYFEVLAPRDLWSLVAIKTRARLGEIQLKSFFPADHARGSRLKSYRHLLQAGIRDPIGLLVFSVVRFVAEYRARRRLSRGRVHFWDRDESARASA